MKVREVMREAWRNVTTGAAYALVLAATTSVLTLGLIWLELSSISDLTREARLFRTSGAAIVVLDSSSNVNGSLCDQLQRIPGVTGSGAVRSGEKLVPLAGPDSPVAVLEATVGFARMIGAPMRTGLVVEKAAMDRLGVRTGEYLPTSTGPLPVSAAFEYPDDGRDPLLQGSALEISRTNGSYDQCWMEVWPYTADRERLVRTALVTSARPDVEVVTSQLNPRLGTELRTSAKFNAREGRWAWVFAMGGAAVISLAVTRLRRLELALARHLAVSRSALMLQLLVETLLWSTLVACGASILVAWMATSGSPGWALVPFGARIALGSLAGSLLGSCLGAVLARETHLFRYFKNRM